MGVTAASPRGPGSAAAPLDARLSLVLALLVGLLTWRGGALAAAAYALACASVVVRAVPGRAARLGLALRVGAVALVWGGIRAALAALAGASPGEAAAAGGLLALRLAALLLLGAAVTARLSPRALGTAAASLARPVLRARAWEAALALALLVHFIPRARARFGAAREALRVRRLALPRRQAALAVLGAGARNLATGTWDQAIAIAARRLDRPEAWASPGPPPARDLAVAGALAAAAIGLALLPV